MAFPIQYPEGFSPASRTWIYQSMRPFNNDELAAAAEAVSAFTQSWLSHGEKVKGTGIVLPEGFIILIADTNITEVSGCSTDSSVRIIKELESRFQLGLFDRQLLAFLIDDEVVRIPLAKISSAIAEKKINTQTPYFNNMVLTLEELKTGWIVPAGNSWLTKKFTAQENPVA